jgi:hypothetical protein
MSDISTADLVPQSYGIAMAQRRHGGPRGIWLECTKCEAADVIRGSQGADWASVTNAEAALVFRRHGWTGNGETMSNPRCPACSKAEEAS